MEAHPNQRRLSPQEVAARLQAAGVQPTAQRIAIGHYLLCEADHPTAEQVKAWADANFPKLSLATVYNTLGALTQAGLVRAFRLPHSESVIYDARVEDHHHFLDEATGELVDLDPGELVITPRLGREKRDYQISGIEVVVRGRINKHGNKEKP